MSNLPSFDFSGSTIRTEEELNASLDKTQKKDTSKVFQPGNYDVTIDEVEYVGAAKDPNWGRLKLTLKGTGTKQILDWVSIPVKDVVYIGKNGKPTAYMFQRFKRFAAALGVAVTPETLAEKMKVLLGKDGSALKNQVVTVTIGYSSAYVNYAGKDEAGLAQFKITFPARGQQAETDLVGPNGKVMLFPDRQSAEEHAIGASINLQKFPEVREYSLAATQKKLANGNW